MMNYGQQNLMNDFLDCFEPSNQAQANEFWNEGLEQFRARSFSQDYAMSFLLRASQYIKPQRIRDIMAIVQSFSIR